MTATDSQSDARQFDAIVVGARIAGCATAYQLARRGWRVALVEKQPLPLSAPLSLPLVYGRAIEQFRALDLMPVLETLLPTLTPIRSIGLHYDGELTLRGQLPSWAGFSDAYILPRAQLDNGLLTFILQQSYPGNGSITLFAHHRVEQLLRVGGDKTVSGADAPQRAVVGVRTVAPDTPTGDSLDLFAPLVIGADGRLSRVAMLLGPAAAPYQITPPQTSFCYIFCRGVDRTGLPDGFMARAKDRRVLMLSEMAPGLQTLGIYLPATQYASFRGQGQRNPAHHTQAELRATWESAPELVGRMQHIELLGKVLGLDPRYGAGYFRPAGGPGWALVGDAAHFKDPASAQGVHDALFTTHMLIDALDQMTGSAPLTSERASGDWPEMAQQLQRRRDAALEAMFDFTNTFSRLLTQPPSRKEYALLRCLADDSALMQQFLGIFMGSTSFATFRQDVVRYLRRRLFAHGVDVIGWVRDIARLFHYPQTAMSSSAYTTNQPTLGLRGSSPHMSG